MRKSIRLFIISFLCSFIFLLPGLKAVAQVSGVKTIPGDYASITQAMQQIRTVGVSGPTYLELQAGYNSSVETFPIKIREIPGTSSVNNITISPAAGATGLSIEADNSEAIIEFIGAYNTIIDGRPGRTGSTRELTIRNNSTAGKIINFFDGAVDNSVTYCKLEGAAISALGLTSFVYFGRSTEPIPDGILLENTGNMMSNCIVTGNNALNTVASVVYAVGNTSVLNSGNKIIDNEIRNFRWAIYIAPDGGSSWTITGNSFYNMSNIGSQSFIYFRPGLASFNNIISGNYIGGTAAQAGGAQAVASDFQGASISGMIIDAGSFVLENNVMQNLKVESTRSARFTGITFERGLAQIRGNRIGGTSELTSIVIAGAASFNGVVTSSCEPAVIENNHFSNVKMEGEFSTKWYRGIMLRAGNGTIVSGNQFDQIISSGTGPVNFMAIGVFSTMYSNTTECPASPQPSVIDHNLIKNITLSSDDDSATFSGIEIFGTGGPATQLHNNRVNMVNVSAPAGIASFSGIHINDRISSNTGNIIGSATEANSIIISGKIANATAILVNESPDASISDDIIGNVKVNGTQSASLDGIRFEGGGVSKISGNQLNDLSVSSTGSSTMLGISFNGAVTSNEPSTLHNNKVYKVNVSSTEGAASFAGIKINDRIAANTGNIIGSSTDANSIVVTGKSPFANGVLLRNSPDVSVSDDVIANIVATGTLTPASVNGILFEAGANAKISGNHVHHLTAPANKGIFINPGNGASTVTLDSNIVNGVNNAGVGIETFVAAEASLNLIATNNTVSNWQTGVLLDAASGATLQQSFQNNAVVANQTGFVNENGAPVNATCNWWGDASGPSGAGPGTGNPVGPNVIFSPWATLSTYVAVNAGADQTITGSGSKTLSPAYTVCGTATYLWSTGATIPSITVSPTVTTVYSIKITDANGHEATDELTVFVQAVSLPKISIISTVVAEGNSGTNNAVFILVLSKLSAVPVTVQYQTSNLTATTPQDYVQKSGTITFPANSLVGLIQTITIQVKADALPETDETFRVLLSNAVNATINITSATCTILDNDPPCLKINDASATENSQQAVVTVSLSSASSKTVKVMYDTKDGTAKAPADYTKVNGTLTFQPGETTKSINVIIKKDALNNEPTEKFQVTLKDAENANITSTSACTARKDATVSIINSGSQQNRQALTSTQLPVKEEIAGVTVPGVLSKHDQLTIRGLSVIGNELVLFDSKGIIVAKLLRYNNSWSPGNISTGIYFYQLRTRSEGGKYKVHTGKIFITD
jgi:hypothetical protein